MLLGRGDPAPEGLIRCKAQEGANKRCKEVDTGSATKEGFAGNNDNELNHKRFSG